MGVAKLEVPIEPPAHHTVSLQVVDDNACANNLVMVVVRALVPHHELSARVGVGDVAEVVGDVALLDQHVEVWDKDVEG